MARMSTLRTALPAALVAAGMVTLSAPASADPAGPAPSPVPVVPAPAPPPAAPADPAAAPVAPLAASDQPAPADGVPHLSSPENLPPGTTDLPTQQGTRLSYWRDLWHAYQTQEVSGSDALLLLTQRPMDADSMPPAGMPAGPQSVPSMTLTGPVPGTGPAAPAPGAPVPPAPGGAEAPAPAAPAGPAAEVLPPPVTP